MSSKTSPLKLKSLDGKQLISNRLVNFLETEKKENRKNSSKTYTEMEVCLSKSSSDEKYPYKDAKDLYDSVVKMSADCKQKLKQVTFTANQFSRHSRREKLTEEGFKKSLKFYGLDDDSEDSDSSNSDSDAKLSDDEDESISITCRGSLLKSNAKGK
ncbi:hypothetical protein TNIN_249741 [Trichonephila inaurata madagascariensis]|uniref:TATA box binding protein associated factor (TAF) histone-like fold domain-containing protein n=1 Tax=Trichonephila inaurata madagascariensis TaxID=2747483 RepID=A0A8X6IXC4_9ARAC|nr:hypothetical protein TNIN_249741 [Trichonephila inaurata madagascariensis]